jgi:hypothetical protein
VRHEEYPHETQEHYFLRYATAPAKERPVDDYFGKPSYINLHPPVLEVFPSFLLESQRKKPHARAIKICPQTLRTSGSLLGMEQKET